jgi:hypothetical protein
MRYNEDYKPKREKRKKYFRLNNLMKNKNSIFIFFNALLIVFSFSLIFFTYADLPPTVPIWYSLPWGAGQLAQKPFLLIIPIISLLFFVVNLLFPQLVRFENTEENEKKIEFLKNSYIFVSFSIAVINMITLIKIVGLFL